MFDTGSGKVWIPLSDCTGCPNTKFNNAASTSYKAIVNYTTEIYYANSGNVTGLFSTDRVCLSNTECTSNEFHFLGIKSVSSLGSLQSDGLVGL